MSKRKREVDESGYKTDQEFYEGEWENLQNELLHEDDKRLTDTTKFELKTIMVGGPAQDLNAAAKYKFLDTIRINHKHRDPIRDTLNELSWRVISNDRKKGNDKKKEIRQLLEVIRTNAQEGGRKRKRKRRRSAKKKRRKRNSKKRTRRRRRKRRR